MMDRLSTFGIGTARGAEDDATDERMAMVLSTGMRRGVTVLDTAINYRRGRSERVVGRAVRQALASGVTSRDKVVVCTKGGYVRQPGGVGTSTAPPELHNSSGHCLEPDCLRYQIETSLETLGLPWVDLYFLHNPEEQASRMSPRPYWELMSRALATLEDAVNDGLIGAYGVATWRSGAQATADGALDLVRLKQLAGKVASTVDHFIAVQAPLSMLHQVALAPSHLFEGARLSLPEVCTRLGIALVASASAGGRRAPAWLQPPPGGRHPCLG